SRGRRAALFDPWIASLRSQRRRRLNLTGMRSRQLRTISMAWFRKSYWCDECSVGWTDEWSCACNDRCPECDAEIEPFESEDLSVQLEMREEGKLWVVFVSPPDAEHRP